MSSPDNRDAVAEALRKALNCLPRYSFLLDGLGNVRRVPEPYGAWIEWQAAHELFDPVKVDSLLEATPALPGMLPMPPFTPAQRAAACVAACDGLPDHALYGGWTAAGLSRHARSLEAKLAAQAPAPVPLTDWQVSDICQKWLDTPGTSFADLVRAAETAHGITTAAKAEQQ